MISDRAILRLEAGGPLDGEIAPASLYEALERTWPDRRARATARAARATPLDAPTDIAAVFARAANLDATLIDLAADPVLGPLDLRVLYLPGLDIVQHSLFGAVERGRDGAGERRRAAQSARAVLRFLDESLAQFTAGSDRLVMLVAEPRPRRAVLARACSPSTGTPASAQHPTAADTAIAPTVLYALGVPVARDLASSAVSDLFSATFVSAHPLRTVSTYGSRRLKPEPARGTRSIGR